MDALNHAAAQLAADIEGQPIEVQQALRYLYARVALDWQLLELVGHEIRESGERLVCREVASGAFYAVDRPQGWTQQDEEAYVEEMKRILDSHGE